VGFFSGRYHLYYSLSTFGSPRSVIGLATNATLDPSSPSYAWEDLGKVVESRSGDDHNAIDAAVVLDAEGDPWLTWGSWGGGIKMRKLDAETGFLSEDDETLYALARRPERAVEGPFVVRREGLYYLFVSFDLCCRGVESTYSVRVGRSDDVTGPYVDRDGVPMIEGGGTLVLGSYGPVRGPGHASVLVVDDGYLLAHHYYDASDAGVPHLQIRPLLWDDEGWPVAGPPFDGTPPGPPLPDEDLTGRWGFWAGEESARSVELGADGIARACNGEGAWSYAAPMLTIRWNPAGPQGQGRTDRMVLAGDGDALAGQTSDGRLVHGYRLAPM
jgi:arabinan endo-1,5-alpha-L-arabinosidase